MAENTGSRCTLSQTDYLALEGIVQPGEDGEAIAPDPDIDFGDDLRRCEKPYPTAYDRLYLAGAQVVEALKHSSDVGKYRQGDVGPHIAIVNVKDVDALLGVE